MNYERAFMESMIEKGIVGANTPMSDGQIHRFHVEGDKNGSSNGWYVLHGGDVPAGAYGSWKTGEIFTWCAKPRNEMSQEEIRALREQIVLAKTKREEERRRLQEIVSGACAEAFASYSTNVNPDHPYLRAKCVDAHGIREHEGNLIIPLCDIDGTLHSFQTISPDGSKRFLHGGRIRGCFHKIGERTEEMILCEGYATGATLYEQTGSGVYVCLTTNNLKPVAQALRNKFPHQKFVIAADNDRCTPGNPGITKAKEAAHAASMRVVWPEFPPCHNGTDFNDLLMLEVSNE